ncbi:MAG TPA: polyhydroxyalkanoate depolymerase [Stellaceae bacterium]|nr:polyhydroxyalkanoate depolymerase [Stellaceae bacterium]
MLYQAYQAQNDVLMPIRLMAQAARGFLAQPWPLLGDHPLVRSVAAACEMVARAGISHSRPEFAIVETVVAGRTLPVLEEEVLAHPFCTLRHFEKPGGERQPRVLVVAPLSGHFATLLRGTVETLLPEHDVYITDWINARNVPLFHGRFGLDDFIDLVVAFLRHLGPRTHVVAVCQPSVPVLAAVSLMAADGDAAQPASMTLMGGPIDTRRNPTQPNRLATSRPLEWFERNVIETVPARYPGAFRRVYPGFLQLAGFMTMNLDRHVSAHFDLFKHLVRGDGESAEATKRFYDEYTAVMDLPADFYLQTIARVFQEHALPLGRFASRGRRVEPAAIRRTALLTVEGENDDICAVGQTAAAHELCTGLPAAMKRHHLQPKVGHYGVFNGRRWRTEIYPKVRDFIAANG